MVVVISARDELPMMLAAGGFFHLYISSLLASMLWIQDDNLVHYSHRIKMIASGKLTTRAFPASVGSKPIKAIRNRQSNKLCNYLTLKT
jgi:hypothetical protein